MSDLVLYEEVAQDNSTCGYALLKYQHLDAADIHTLNLISLLASLE